ASPKPALPARAEPGARAPKARSDSHSKPARVPRSAPAADRPRPAPDRPAPPVADRSTPAAASPARPAPGREPSGRSQRAPQREAMTEQLPARPQPHEVRAARAAMDPSASRSAPSGYARSTQPGPAMQIPISATPPGALENDPLTSPSFSAVPAGDSRSYRGARKHARPSAGNGTGPATDPGVPAAGHQGPANGYHSSPPPARVPASPPGAPGGW